MEVGFDDGVTVDEVNIKFVIKVDAMRHHGGARYCSAEAGTGYRYAVTASVLPAAAIEGGPVLVTVTSPWVDAWALQTSGFLSEGYVREHLCGGPTRRVSDADVRAMTLLVRHALNRTGDL